MSNFTSEQNKLAAHLQELYRKHKLLDKEIELMYSKYSDDLSINKLKGLKLWYKDEIHRIETELMDKKI